MAMLVITRWYMYTTQLQQQPNTMPPIVDHLARRDLSDLTGSDSMGNAHIYDA